MKKKIKQTLAELGNYFFQKQKMDEDLSLFGGKNQIDEDSYYEEIVRHEYYFESSANKLRYLITAYLDSKHLHRYLDEFQKEINPFFQDKNKLFSFSFHPDDVDVVSNFIKKIYEFLYPLDILDDNDDQKQLNKIGFYYLNTILESTSFILKQHNIVPSSEVEVYKAVEPYCKVVFPNAIYPSRPFFKLAKEYKPDILLSGISCAIEYKFSSSEKKLDTTITQIFDDVHGYSKNKDYKVFYAVFYTKSGTCTKARFNELWKEKEFPENWISIFTEGD